MQVLKIQPQTLKSSYIKLIPLLFSLVHSLLLVILVTATVISGVVFIIVLFSIFGIAYLISAIIYIIISKPNNERKCLKLVWLIDAAYIFGGLLYFAGRNFQSSPATPVLLGMVVVFYRFIPFFISKYYQSNLAKEHQTTEAKFQLVPEWILVAESLTLLVEFDAWYTVMLISFARSFSQTPCSVASIGAWVIWALFVLIYSLILYYTMNIQYCGSCNSSSNTRWATNYAAVVLVAVFGMYLLSSNGFPLYCYEAVNLPSAIIVMKIFVLIMVITVIVLLVVYRCLSKTRQEKLLPQALYEQLYPETDTLPYEAIPGNEEQNQDNA